MVLIIPLIEFTAGTKAVAADVNSNFSAISADVIANYNSIQIIESNYVHTDGTTPFTAQQNGVDPTIGTQGLVTVNYLNKHQVGFNYLEGFNLSNDSTNFQSTIDISAGQCSDSQNICVMTQKTPFNKNLFNTWQEGTGNGGRASSVTLSSNTTYHVFAISDTNGNNVDFGFDTSLTAVNLLSTATSASSIQYTQFRRIGSIITEPSNYNITGTVDINGTSTITGTNTLFTKQCVVGDSIIVNSETKIIQTITSDTEIITTVAFTSTATLQVAQLSGTNAIIPFTQQGNYFYYKTRILDINNEAQGTFTTTVPSLPVVGLYTIQQTTSGSDVSAFVYSPYEYPIVNVGDVQADILTPSASFSTGGLIHIEVPTNNATITVVGPNAFYVITKGYIDNLRG